MAEEITLHDRRTRRCPMLGHPIEFSYCRSPGSPLPCRKVFDCWWETFDVESFVRAHYSEKEIEKVLAPRKDKMSSIVELIQQARRAAEDLKNE